MLLTPRGPRAKSGVGRPSDTSVVRPNLHFHEPTHAGVVLVAVSPGTDSTWRARPPAKSRMVPADEGQGVARLWRI